MKRWIGRTLKNQELLWTASGQSLMVLQSLVLTKVLTNSLSQENYGQWALVMSIVLLIGMLPFSAFDQGVTSLVGNLETQTARAALLNRAVLVYSSLFLIWTALLAAVGLLAFPNRLGFVGLVLIFTYSEILRNAIVSFANSTRERKVVVVQRSWDLFSRCGLLLAAAAYSSLEVSTVLIILSATNAVGIAVSWNRAGRPSAAREETVRGTLASLLQYSWPLVVWAVFGWLQTMVSRWYLAGSAGQEAVANYAVVVSVSFFIPSFVYTIVASYLLPVLFARDGPLPPRQYLQVMGLFACVLAVYTLLTIPAAPWLLLVLTDETYVPMAPFVPWLTASSSLFMVASLFTIELFRAGRTSALLLPSIAPGLLSLSLGFLLVAKFGLVGAVVTYAIGQLVYAAAAVTVSSRHIGIISRERTQG